MSNVVSLCEYRAKRAHASAMTLTERAAHLVAIASHVVDAEYGYELAGCPTAQLIQGAPAGRAFWGRLEAGNWLFVANSDVAWQASKGWTLRKVRLVTPMAREV